MATAMEAPRYATVDVLHRCGHTEARELTQYHWKTKSWNRMRAIQPTNPALADDAPAAVKKALESYRKKIGNAASKAEKYWGGQNCRDCWQKEERNVNPS